MVCSGAYAPALPIVIDARAKSTRGFVEIKQMLRQPTPVAVKIAASPKERSQDRSMDVLQYAVAAVALVGAVLLAAVR